ncbi:efflux RND transporter periplasmic adaptor subunit [Thiocapsa marina]|uniref:Secretion protein HlyD family protein n=1 Tax=Thiocapsa marina 5811 TaxID=768671 RepID=F9UFD5_9GAMM|nr:efflux RND transporter periplasmic adaptor subunit [Thiocapsa marina]EGV17172.1 secretion protein HlyD family protein [Thiocapsa marina 5811]
MKKILIPILVLALAVGGYLLYRGERTPEHDPGRLTLYGNIDVRLVNLAFEVSGRINAMPIAEGARVEAGQVLAALDARRLELAREIARAQVAAQRSELEKLIAGPRPEEIEKLRADAEAARTEAANAERHAERTKGLADRKMASPQEYDDARTAAEAAQARAGAARAALDLALAGSRAEDIARARANLAALEGDLAEAELNLAYARLVAPATGVVQNRILEPGDMASPERPVYTIAMNEPLWARVYLAEPDLGRVRQGQPAQVFSDSFPGKAYSGWLGYISPSAEFTPKTVQTTELRADLVYQARVYVCNPAGELRQGMPVTVEIDLTRAPLPSPGCPPATDSATSDGAAAEGAAPAAPPAAEPSTSEPGSVSGHAESSGAPDAPDASIRSDRP